MPDNQLMPNLYALKAASKSQNLCSLEVSLLVVKHGHTCEEDLCD